MTREQHLFHCKKCVKRKMDMQQGLLCSLTGEKADFEETCSNFEQDENVKSEDQLAIENIKPNKTRAEIATRLIWVIMLLSIVSIVSEFMQHIVLSNLQKGIYVSDEIIDSNDNREQIIGIVYLIVFIISVITFIQWYRRAYFNLTQRTKCDQTEGWAAANWFIPIVNWFKPYQMMKEMWNKTNFAIQINGGEIKDNKNLVGLWWIFWIISTIVGRISLKAYKNPETIEEFIYSNYLSIADSVVVIPLSIITVLMIKAYSAKEEKLNELEASKNKTIKKVAEGTLQTGTEEHR